MSRRIQFVLAMALQLLILAGLVVSAELTLRHGVRVELEVEPFDPIDPLSGRHLVVNLAVARLDSAIVDTTYTLSMAPGEVLYVEFDPDSTPAVPIRASSLEPTDGRLYARAVIRQSEPSLRVDYGLDRFFIPLDATDPTLFRDSEGVRPQLRLVARIDSSGRIVTEDLLVDGRPFAEWNASVKPR